MQTATLFSIMTRTPGKPDARRRTGGTRPRHAAPDRAVQRREVTASAYQRLRDLIVSGRLAPGAPLIETDLSTR